MSITAGAKSKTDLIYPFGGVRNAIKRSSVMSSIAQRTPSLPKPLILTPP